MARDDLTFDQVVAATELDERTLRSLARATTNPTAPATPCPHSRTLHDLPQGIAIEIHDLFRPIGRVAPRQFDRVTNSLVESCVARYAQLFKNWSQSDFDELYSRFGTGGQLTEDGI